MNYNKSFLRTAVSAVVLATILISPQLNAESVSEKSKAKRQELLRYMTFLNNAIENFGKPDQVKKFEELKEKYSSGLAFYFEATVPIPKKFPNKYLESYNIFLEVLKDVDKLLAELSIDYIDRTQELLHHASKDVVDIAIRFDRDSPLVKRFQRPVDKEVETRPTYNTKDYHKYYDKKDIINNLSQGYSTLGTARIVRQKALDLEDYLETEQLKNGLPITMISNRVESFIKVIELTRQAKVNAIFAFQLLRRNLIYCVQEVHSKNIYMVEKNLDPVFDPRIPPEYVKDANDAFNLSDKNERDIKLKQEFLEKDKQVPQKECKYTTNTDK